MFEIVLPFSLIYPLTIVNHNTKSMSFLVKKLTVVSSRFVLFDLKVFRMMKSFHINDLRFGLVVSELAKQQLWRQHLVITLGQTNLKLLLWLCLCKVVNGLHILHFKVINKT